PGQCRIAGGGLWPRIARLKSRQALRAGRKPARPDRIWKEDMRNAQGSERNASDRGVAPCALRLVQERSDMLIDELKAIQARYHYLPEEELQALSERSKVPLYQIQGVASFFPHFRLAPPPELEIQVCAHLACHLRGAPALRRALQQRYAEAGAAVTIGDCSCLVQCDRAPA